jgi:3-oxoacyl-[acyl-carrier protein] reductase
LDLKLSGKVALVTGASRGIGRAIAVTLAAEGCTLAVNARNAADLSALSLTLAAGTTTHPGDVTDSDQANAVVEGAIAAHRRLEIVVCNVGSGASVPPGQETAAEWQRVFDVNLWSATNVIEACSPHLREGASIVCISSVCGLEALGAPATYSVAKAALNSMVKNLARPLGRRGIRLNAVAPGNILFDGSVWDRKTKEDRGAVAAMLDRDVPLGRLGSPEEVADMVAFLASPRAGFITGATIVADGGQTRS